MAQMEASASAISSTSANETIRLPSYGSVDRVLIRHCQPMNPNLRLLRKGSTHKRFDSGDWCLERQGLRCSDDIPLDVSMEQLSPKLYPEPAAVPRARSALQFSRNEADSNEAFNRDAAHV